MIGSKILTHVNKLNRKIVTKLFLAMKIKGQQNLKKHWDQKSGSKKTRNYQDLFKIILTSCSQCMAKYLFNSIYLKLSIFDHFCVKNC